MAELSQAKSLQVKQKEQNLRVANVKETTQYIVTCVD